MSRPQHKPTEQDRKTVRAMSAYGVPHEGIAAVLDIDDKTLRKHYRRELDTAHVEANVKVAESLFKQATNGNTAAAIFWMKVRAGWVEKQKLDLTSNDEPLTTIRVVYADVDPNTADPAPGPETDS